jgi:hypothetical protein
MPKQRKTWQTPALGEVTVHGAWFGPALQSGEIAGPPGGPVLGPFYGPQPQSLMGPPAPGPAFWGPTGVPPASLSQPRLQGPNVFGPSVPSDVRLKEKIQRIGTTAHGLPLYKFSYRGQAEIYEGVMAQDVLAVRPDAVAVDDDGYYSVNYEKLGVVFRRIH